MNPLEMALDDLRKATCPEEVFGTMDIDEAFIEKEYRYFVRIVHPDKHPTQQDEATECFQLLQKFYEQALKKLEAGTYGDDKPVEPDKKEPEFEPILVKSGKKEYTLVRQMDSGDIANIFECKTADTEHLVFKLSCSPADNDLLEREAANLKVLNEKPLRVPYNKMLPQLVDSFLVKVDKTPARRANILSADHTDGCVNLSQIQKEYPDGLGFRHIAWMFKRMLLALTYVHEMGLVHGAILPEHVLVHPLEHGCKLIGWSHAVKVGETVKTISTARKDLYAPEILAKQPVSPATDIYMAARTALFVMGKHATSTRSSSIPDAKVVAFLNACALANPARRPDDAFSLHKEFDELLLKLVGKPTYTPLEYPAKKAK